MRRERPVAPQIVGRHGRLPARIVERGVTEQVARADETVGRQLEPEPDRTSDRTRRRIAVRGHRHERARPPERRADGVRHGERLEDLFHRRERRSAPDDHHGVAPGRRDRGDGAGAPGDDLADTSAAAGRREQPVRVGRQLEVASGVRAVDAEPEALAQRVIGHERRRIEGIRERPVQVDVPRPGFRLVREEAQDGLAVADRQRQLGAVDGERLAVDAELREPDAHRVRPLEQVGDERADGRRTGRLVVEQHDADPVAAPRDEPVGDELRLLRLGHRLARHIEERGVDVSRPDVPAGTGPGHRNRGHRRNPSERQ